MVDPLAGINIFKNKDKRHHIVLKLANSEQIIVFGRPYGKVHLEFNLLKMKKA